MISVRKCSPIKLNLPAWFRQYLSKRTSIYEKLDKKVEGNKTKTEKRNIMEYVEPLLEILGKEPVNKPIILWVCLEIIKYDQITIEQIYGTRELKEPELYEMFKKLNKNFHQEIYYQSITTEVYFQPDIIKSCIDKLSYEKWDEEDCDYIINIKTLHLYLRETQHLLCLTVLDLYTYANYLHKNFVIYTSMRNVTNSFLLLEYNIPENKINAFSGTEKLTYFNTIAPPIEKISKVLLKSLNNFVEGLFTAFRPEFSLQTTSISVAQKPWGYSMDYTNFKYASVVKPYYKSIEAYLCFSHVFYIENIKSKLFDNTFTLKTQVELMEAMNTWKQHPYEDTLHNDDFLEICRKNFFFSFKNFLAINPTIDSSTIILFNINTFPITSNHLVRFLYDKQRFLRTALHLFYVNPSLYKHRYDEICAFEW